MKKTAEKCKRFLEKVFYENSYRIESVASFSPNYTTTTMATKIKFPDGS